MLTQVKSPAKLIFISAWADQDPAEKTRELQSLKMLISKSKKNATSNTLFLDTVLSRKDAMMNVLMLSKPVSINLDWNLKLKKKQFKLPKKILNIYLTLLRREKLTKNWPRTPKLMKNLRKRIGSLKKKPLNIVRIKKRTKLKKLFLSKDLILQEGLYLVKNITSSS